MSANRDVCFWAKAAISTAPPNVRFWGIKRTSRLCCGADGWRPLNEELRESFRRVAMALSWARSLMGSRWRCEGRGPGCSAFQLVGAQWPRQHSISFMWRQAAHYQLQVMRVVLHADPA